MASHATIPDLQVPATPRERNVRGVLLRQRRRASSMSPAC